jgi:pyrroline-5-carboxylate reductase
VDGARLAVLKKKWGVRTEKDNRTAVQNADVVVLCVKPQHMGGLLDELAGHVAPQHVGDFCGRRRSSGSN